jgi:hypothetical protein
LLSMKIEVEFSPAFQSRLSLQRQTFFLEEARPTVKDLFERLVEKHGGKISPLLFAPEKEEILSGLLVMVNDRLFTGTALNQEDVRLGDGDKVGLLYFMSGG